jgi:hypothetical protein
MGEWLEEAERLAMDFAHCYSFVGDDTMPKAKAALLAHLRQRQTAKVPPWMTAAHIASLTAPLEAMSSTPPDAARKDALLRKAREALSMMLDESLRFSSHGVVPLGREVIAEVDAELKGQP